MKRVFRFILYLPRRIVSFPIKLYRKFVSPAKGIPCCRFVPSCSEYALIAIERWGAIVGTALALWRVLRCNPFGKGGYDPVPERKSKSKENN